MLSRYASVQDFFLTSRTTTLTGPLLIGPRSALAHNTSVQRSTLGADCAIGPNTTISRSYVFDDVRIGANCTLEECMIGKSVEIRDGVRVGKGALIGNGVRLGKGIVIPDFARIGRKEYRPDGEDDEDEEEKANGITGTLRLIIWIHLMQSSSTTGSRYRFDRICLAERRGSFRFRLQCRGRRPLRAPQ